MNIAIDIDDTLTETFTYFQPFVAEYFGVDIEYLQKRNLSYNNLPDEWKAEELNFCKTYFDKVVVNTPFKQDAAWGVNELRKRGHKIIIITGRTTDFYTDPVKTASEELMKGGITYDKLICTIDKGGACLAEKVDLLIDDLPDNCDAAFELGIKTIMFQSKANKDIKTKHIKLSDWKSVVEMVDRIFG